MQGDYEKDLAFCHLFILLWSSCEAGDLAGVERILAAMDEEWARSDKQAHVNLLRIACDTMTSAGFRDTERSRSLVERYATIALSNADDSQIDVQLYLLDSYLRVDSESGRLKGEKWSEARTDSAELWFGVWQRLEDSIDRDWDPEDPKNDVEPYVPPEGVVFASGMSPDAIEDPSVRAEYEAHLKKNERIAANNYQQRKLRRVQEEYSQKVEDYVIRIYSIPEFNMEELKAHLTNLEDEKMSKRILDAVSKNVPKK